MFFLSKPPPSPPHPLINPPQPPPATNDIHLNAYCTVCSLLPNTLLRNCEDDPQPLLRSRRPTFHNLATLTRICLSTPHHPQLLVIINWLRTISQLDHSFSQSVSDSPPHTIHTDLLGLIKLPRPTALDKCSSTPLYPSQDTFALNFGPHFPCQRNLHCALLHRVNLTPSAVLHTVKTNSQPAITPPTKLS